jgi:tRNA (guanine-N7-)-methyltransferase
LREALAAEFPEPGVLTLEIGCGHGHFLAAYAAANPGETCVGIDIVSKRVRRGSASVEARARQPALHEGRGQGVLEVLPAHVTLARTFILFPDPWPKKGQIKRRLVQEPLLTRLAARTAPGGLLHLRSDHGELFSWMQQQVATHPAWVLAPEQPWPFEASSYFQDLMDSWQSVTAVRL